MNDEIDAIERNDRGYVDSSISNPNIQTSKFQTYMKPPIDEGMIVATKKQARIPKETTAPLTQDTKSQKETIESRSLLKESQGIPPQKKGGKTISLAEAAKGFVVFQQGKPCSCQARSHKLMSNGLSCGKIVCEQEGEGPSNFYGALVLREGSIYTGINDLAVPHSKVEAAAEVYVKEGFAEDLYSFKLIYVDFSLREGVKIRVKYFA